MQCVMNLGAGKSSLAQQLASRFNMPNVLQTDMFYEVCCSTTLSTMSVLFTASHDASKDLLTSALC